MTLKKNSSPNPVGRFTQLIGHSRFIVLLAVGAVMLVAVTLFLLGSIKAIESVWEAWHALFRNDLRSTRLTLEFLEIVSVMLKAVVFYIIGVGLYSLFVAPLNITVSLGVETLADLESKVISVVIVILGVTFLEHFVAWEDPVATLQFGGAMALVVASLVLFQHYSHMTKEDQKSHKPDEQTEARQHMFEENDEEARITASQVSGTARKAED